MTSHMEDSLGMPLSDVLPVMQHRLMTESTWFGVRALKSPTDFWVCQEIIVAIRPDVIVEIGNNLGGSTLALAHFCDLLGHGRVIGVDISHASVPAVVTGHPRIHLVEGDACASFPRVQALIGQGERVLIIEDSAHTFDNTLNVLRTYSPLVSPGSYFIVEDGICHHGLDIGPDPGPYEAVEAFLGETADFEVDRTRESFLITWNPLGYLRRRGELAARSAVSSTAPARRSWRSVIALLVPPIVPLGLRKLRARRR